MHTAMPTCLKSLLRMLRRWPSFGGCSLSMPCVSETAMSAIEDLYDVAMVLVSISYDQLHEVSEYAAEVRGRAFPGPEHVYSIDDDELESFRAGLRASADVEEHSHV